MEEWKTIKGFEDYQVSNLGRVKSFKCNRERIMKTGTDGRGYPSVMLRAYFKAKAKNKQVHQLVAIAFLNHTPCGLVLVVDHINDIKTDNRVENLQIVTNRFNVCKTQGNYSSDYKGVHWNKQKKKWASQIRLKGKKKHLGLFTNEEEASKTYQTALLTLKTQNL